MILESAEYLLHDSWRELRADCFELEGQTHAQEQEDAEGPDVTLDERASSKQTETYQLGVKVVRLLKDLGGHKQQIGGFEVPLPLYVHLGHILNLHSPLYLTLIKLES